MFQGCDGQEVCQGEFEPVALNVVCFGCNSGAFCNIHQWCVLPRSTHAS
jgi:hypothetical protein